uniref:Uncharacterized protein n=1 Tax=Oryza meridionalis TaxID=40149 RepID=A0A0E0F4A4_9ORYZ
MRSSVLATDPYAHQRRRQIRDLIVILHRISVFVVIVLQTIETKKASRRSFYISSVALEEGGRRSQGQFVQRFWLGGGVERDEEEEEEGAKVEEARR